MNSFNSWKGFFVLYTLTHWGNQMQKFRASQVNWFSSICKEGSRRCRVTVGIGHLAELIWTGRWKWALAGELINHLGRDFPAASISKGFILNTYGIHIGVPLVLSAVGTLRTTSISTWKPFLIAGVGLGAPLCWYLGGALYMGVDFEGQPGHVPSIIDKAYDFITYYQLTTHSPQYFGCPKYFWQVYPGGAV